MSTAVATTPKPRDLILAWAEKHKVTIEATFIPYSKSRNAGKWESLNWRVTLKRGTYTVLTTEYSAGIGHTPAYARELGKGAWGNYDKRARDLTAKAEIEAGRAMRPVFYYGDRPFMPSLGKPILPDPCDVLASLAMDADVLEYRGFSDWCASLGYDDDSIKARRIYDDCIEQALKLRAGLGDDAIAELNEARIDY